MISDVYIHVGILKGNPISRVIVLIAGKHDFFLEFFIHRK